MYKSKLPILQWAEEDRPREKLLLKGKASLSDAELIAILIGSGNRQLSAVELSKLIMASVDHDLNNLYHLTVNDLSAFKGIGKAKAIAIVAALELGKRRQTAGRVETPQITSSQDVYELMRGDLEDLKFEEFWILLLNRSNKVIKKEKVSAGGVSGTVADPKIIFKHALDNLASSVILIHNHPSGNLKPSEADIRLTKKLKESGIFLEVPILDHLIISHQGYFSFADDGLL